LSYRELKHSANKRQIRVKYDKQPDSLTKMTTFYLLTLNISNLHKTNLVWPHLQKVRLCNDLPQCIFRLHYVICCGAVRGAEVSLAITAYI